MDSQIGETNTETDTVALLVFSLGEQTYGLPVTHVVRIIEMVTITHLPNCPDVIQGIINLQGTAVPVIDLRLRFGLVAQPYGLHTPIVLVDIDGGDNGRILGVVVDSVDDVINVPPEDLAITETFIPTELAEEITIRATHLVGVANVDRQLILVLNVRALLTQSEHTGLELALDNKVPTSKMI